MVYILVKDHMEKKREYHHKNLKAAITERAIEMLEQGIAPQDLSVRAIAGELGVSPAAPYRHFPDAKHLLSAVSVIGFKKLVKRMTEVEKSSLSHVGKAYVSFSLENRGLYKAMFFIPRDEVGNYPELEQISREAYGILTLAVKNLHYQNLSQPIPESLATLAAWAYIHGICELAINNLTGPVELDDGIIDQLTSVMVSGLSYGSLSPTQQ